MTSTTSTNPPHPCTTTPSAQVQKMRTWRFWAVIVSLQLAGLLSALEGTIITSALPTITGALGGGDTYIWIPNAYLLATVAVLPLCGQLSNIFGRRNLLLSAVALFTLGSGLSGGASSMGMLIAARTIQGVGGGAMNLLVEIVVTDLVPLRERGKYMAIVMMGATLGAALGPVLGGIITDKLSWRWCFYLNVPIGGITFIALAAFLRVKYRRTDGWRTWLARVDIFGNLIFIGTIVSVLIAMTWGGTLYKWQNYHILAPLILGLLGLLLFTAFEWTPALCPSPSFPRNIVSNRTSATALILTFIHAVVTFWTYYFLPIYFQSVKTSTPLQSGTFTIPTFAGGLSCALIGGVLLSKTGRYKPLHLIGFAPFTISFVLLSLLDQNSSPTAWVFFQLIAAFGSGSLVSILLPAVQAPLDESLVASSTSLWTFARYFGCIWGVTIPSAIFNNECTRLAQSISDPEVADFLTGGRAYQYATAAFVNQIQDSEVRDQVIGTFRGALRTVWLVGTAFAGLGLLLVFIEKEIPLRNELNTEFGIKDGKKNESVVVVDEQGTELTGVQASTAETRALS